MRPKIDINKNSDIDEAIIFIMSNKNLQSVNELVNSVEQNYKISKKQIMERILFLQNNKKIILQDALPQQGSLQNYIFSVSAYWYLSIQTLSLITITLILVDLSQIPLIGTAFVYLRYFLGSLFVLFLPGYSFIKALFPDKEIDNIERFAFSICTSLAIVAINALLLNFTPWGISTVPITLSLLGLTIGTSTIAVLREYQIKYKK